MLTRRDALGALLLLALLAAPAACKRRPRPGTLDAGAAGSDAGTSARAGDGGFVDPGDAGEAGAASADAGALYRTVSGGFQVRFPEGKAPEVEEKTIISGGSAVHLFKIQYGTSGYIVTYDDFAKGSSGRTAQQILDGAREGVVETTGGTIDSQQPLTLDGNPGLDLALTATTSGITMRQHVRVFLVNGRLYQLIVVAPTWSGATVLEQEFFDSFKLLSDAGP